MMEKTFPLSRVYRLLEPGPVVLVTTSHKGKANIMTQSWHTMMEFVPPLVGCVIGGRNHNFYALTATRECVLNMPSVELAKQVVGVGQLLGQQGGQKQLFRAGGGQGLYRFHGKEFALDAPSRQVCIHGGG